MVKWWGSVASVHLLAVAVELVRDVFALNGRCPLVGNLMYIASKTALC